MKQSKEQAAQTLQGAIDLLSRRGGWTKGEAAKDSAGNSVYVHDEDATCFCVFGAVRRAAGEHNDSYTAMSALEKQIGTYAIGSWNDRQKSKRAVLAALSKALADVEAKP